MNLWQTFVRKLAWVLLRLLYRVRVINPGQIPATGAAILAPNHVSFIDAVLIAAHLNRPVRYAMYWKLYRRFRWVVAPMGAFPIASKAENATIYAEAFDTISATLKQGGLVCLFPEGKITLDGEVDEFRNGIRKIVERDPCPIVPIALTGLWGSYFSKKKPGMWKLPDHFGANIQMRVGAAMEPTSTPEEIRDRVCFLIGQDHG